MTDYIGPLILISLLSLFAAIATIPPILRCLHVICCPHVDCGRPSYQTFQARPRHGRTQRRSRCWVPMVCCRCDTRWDDRGDWQDWRDVC